ncbi:hypothetical protein pipiens_005234 [Culex pipiens pipiens]|uniref:Uncharacterized protein n=1 Tax=Culex pipiens pipiens TaxID=38569 RepID=A0ABD1DYD8_CULPP
MNGSVFLSVKLVRRENQVVVSWVVDTSLEIIELLAELGIDKAEKAERTVTMIREVFRKHFQNVYKEYHGPVTTIGRKLPNALFFFLHGHGGAFRMCNSEIDSKIKNDQKQEEAQQHHHANHRPHLVPWHKRARASATQNSAPEYFRMNTPLGSALNVPSNMRLHRLVSSSLASPIRIKPTAAQVPSRFHLQLRNGVGFLRSCCCGCRRSTRPAPTSKCRPSL